MNLSELIIEKRFLKFTEIGGYNVTWNARKPSVPVFDKGTTFIMRSQFQSVWIK